VKKDIHPKYYPDAVVSCACGNSWTVGSTAPEIRVDVCSKCHPFFSGEQRIVDAGGQVERFRRRLARAVQDAPAPKAEPEAEPAAPTPGKRIREQAAQDA
jgi:large subunit ribosomal protein L31